MRAYTSSQSSALDVAAQADGIAGFELMRRAGVAAFEQIARRYPFADTLLILAGKGNNGGDAWIVAGAASIAGWRVHLFQLGLTQPAASHADIRLSPTAALARDWALERGVTARPETAVAEFPSPASLLSARGSAPGSERCVLVDGLLGTGLRDAPRPEIQAAISWVNAQSLPVVALDLPSGLSTDTGAVPGGWPDTVVRADLTVTFIGMKLGLLTGRGPECAGQLAHELIGVDVPRLAQQLELPAVPILGTTFDPLPPRDRTAHKNQFGHALVLAGDHGGGGAALLAAEAALRAGAGLVSVGTRESHVAAMLARRPELMVRVVEGQLAAAELAQRASTVVVGPGLGQAAWGQQLFGAALGAAHSGARLVIDADALNLLAASGKSVSTLPEGCVLTPHPGEAARLLGCSTQKIEADRVAAVCLLAQRYSCVVVLKGAGTLVADKNGLVALCTLGNPGMASAGMGDTLAGLIGGLAAQHDAGAHWVARAVQFHAAAGDRAAARLGEASLLATDVIEELPNVLARGGQ